MNDKIQKCNGTCEVCDCQNPPIPNPKSQILNPKSSLTTHNPKAQTLNF